MVQNAAAGLPTNTKKWEHVPPVLASLYWLTVYSRMQFKVLMGYRAARSLAPAYAEDMIHRKDLLE